MKPTKLITLAALLGTCAFASAQDEAKRPERPKRELPAEILKKFDKDGDGKLSEEEFKAMQDERKAENEKRRAEMLKKYDKDGDGKLSDEERATMKAEMEAKRAALLEKYDANKNGKLDPEEIKAARDAGEDIPMGRGPGGPGGRRGGPPDGKGPGGPPPDGGAPPAPPTE
ncbi:MAG: EF-hand domain-containing protein [Luteolibacter sp.]